MLHSLAVRMRRHCRLLFRVGYPSETTFQVVLQLGAAALQVEVRDRQQGFADIEMQIVGLVLHLEFDVAGIVASALERLQ